MALFPSRVCPLQTRRWAFVCGARPRRTSLPLPSPSTLMGFLTRLTARGHPSVYRLSRVLKNCKVGPALSSRPDPHGVCALPNPLAEARVFESATSPALCAPTENERPRLPKQSGPSNSVGKRGMRCVPLRRISFKHRLLLTSPSRADPLIALARPSERPPCAYRPYRLNDSAVTFRLSAPAFAVLSAEPSRALIQELITWLSWPSRRVQSV
jgi:hypothetical protein